jgi:hypothetical protein
MVCCVDVRECLHSLQEKFLGNVRGRFSGIAYILYRCDAPLVDHFVIGDVPDSIDPTTPDGQQVLDRFKFRMQDGIGNHLLILKSPVHVQTPAHQGFQSQGSASLAVLLVVVSRGVAPGAGWADPVGEAVWLRTTAREANGDVTIGWAEQDGEGGQSTRVALWQPSGEALVDGPLSQGGQRAHGRDDPRQSTEG